MRRRAALILGVAGVVVAATMLLTLLQQPVFEATAEVVVDPGPRVAQGATAALLDREIRTIRSPALAREVAAALRPAAWTVAQLQRSLSVTRPPDTLSLTIGFDAASATAAARVANAFAATYAELTRRAAPGTRPYARVISPAEPPLAPISPRPWRNLLAALLAGAVLGLAAALTAERLFGGLVTSDEVERRLGLPHLTGVPLLASALPEARSAPDAIVQSPRSGFAETFRSLLQAIDYAGGRDARIVAVTSARAGEGKTTVAACLARTIALRGKSVVVVDCGGGAAAGNDGPGLRQVLGGDATLDAVLIQDEAGPAWTLPLGPAQASAELLAGPALSGLLGLLRGRFDHVLIDVPAILADPEAPSIAALAEFMLVVVRWRSTPDRAVKAALQLLESAGARPGGIVLSAIDLRKQVKYAHGDAAFYYRQYSKYYS